MESPAERPTKACSTSEWILEVDFDGSSQKAAWSIDQHAGGAGAGGGWVARICRD